MAQQSPDLQEMFAEAIEELARQDVEIARLRKTQSEIGTALFYAIEALGGEFRISMMEACHRGGDPSEVSMSFDPLNGDIVFQSREPSEEEMKQREEAKRRNGESQKPA